MKVVIEITLDIDEQTWADINDIGVNDVEDDVRTTLGDVSDELDHKTVVAQTWGIGTVASLVGTNLRVIEPARKYAVDEWGDRIPGSDATVPNATPQQRASRNRNRTKDGRFTIGDL
jgi:hypothetical protein